MKLLPRQSPIVDIEPFMLPGVVALTSPMQSQRSLLQEVIDLTDSPKPASMSVVKMAFQSPLPKLIIDLTKDEEEKKASPKSVTDVLFFDLDCNDAQVNAILLNGTP
jgi:hypothetical protein